MIFLLHKVNLAGNALLQNLQGSKYTKTHLVSIKIELALLFFLNNPQYLAHFHAL